MSKRGITPKGQSTTQAIDPVDMIVQKQKEQANEEHDEADIHRVAFNMPKELYNYIHPRLKKKKITMTNYILSLIRKDLGKDKIEI